MTPKYLNSVTNSKVEPERQRGGSKLINIERLYNRNIDLDLEEFRDRKLVESHKDTELRSFWKVEKSSSLTIGQKIRMSSAYKIGVEEGD